MAELPDGWWLIQAAQILDQCKTIRVPHYLVAFNTDQFGKLQRNRELKDALTVEQLRIHAGCFCRVTDTPERFEYILPLCERANIEIRDVCLRVVIEKGWLDDPRAYIKQLMENLERCRSVGLDPAVVMLDQEHTRYDDLEGSQYCLMEDVCLAYCYTIKTWFPKAEIMAYGYPSVAFRWNGYEPRGLWPELLEWDLMSCDLYENNSVHNNDTYRATWKWSDHASKILLMMPFVSIDGYMTDSYRDQGRYLDTPPVDRNADQGERLAHDGWLRNHARYWPGKTPSPDGVPWPDYRPVENGGPVRGYVTIGPLPETNENVDEFNPQKIIDYAKYLAAYANGSSNQEDWRPGGALDGGS
jgi:hypothetical protein